LQPTLKDVIPAVETTWVIVAAVFVIRARTKKDPTDLAA